MSNRKNASAVPVHGGSGAGSAVPELVRVSSNKGKHKNATATNAGDDYSNYYGKIAHLMSLIKHKRVVSQEKKSRRIRRK
jgi:hypothetical protein